MRVFVLGANGRTGQLVIASALQRGHTVTAFVRNSSSIAAQDKVKVAQGSPLSLQDIETAIDLTPEDPVTAIIVALNASRTSDSPFAKPLAPPFFIRDCVRNCLAAMRPRGIKKIVVMSAFGVGNSFRQLPFLFKLVFRHTNMKVQMEDHDAADAEIRQANDVEWTLARPVVLKDGDAAEVKEVGELGKGAGLMSGITRASVAEFMVVAVEVPQWSRQAIVIMN